MNLNEIKNVKIPFTLYDFFGYLIPGLTFLSIILFSSDIPNAIELIVQKLTTANSISPHYFVLNDILNIFKQSPFFVTSLILLTSYICGHIIAVLASLFFERLIVERLLNYPTNNLFYSQKLKHKYIFPKYRRAYSKEFIDKFTQIFSDKYGLSTQDANDTFWISFEYIANHCPNAFARSIHFLNLYGFSRNLSMSFLLSCLIILLLSCVYNFPINLLLIILYIIISFALFWNYLKLLRRLNDEVFRGFYTHIAV
jgi:ABC-type transport system involved in cytochrome bd biosynthesis fused ATPase/permease subunit